MVIAAIFVFTAVACHADTWDDKPPGGFESAAAPAGGGADWDSAPAPPQAAAAAAPASGADWDAAPAPAGDQFGAQY